MACQEALDGLPPGRPGRPPRMPGGQARGSLGLRGMKAPDWKGLLRSRCDALATSRCCCIASGLLREGRIWDPHLTTRKD